MAKKRVCAILAGTMLTSPQGREFYIVKPARLPIIKIPAKLTDDEQAGKCWMRHGYAQALPEMLIGTDDEIIDFFSQQIKTAYINAVQAAAVVNPDGGFEDTVAGFSVPHNGASPQAMDERAIAEAKSRKKTFKQPGHVRYRVMATLLAHFGAHVNFDSDESIDELISELKAFKEDNENSSSQ